MNTSHYTDKDLLNMIRSGGSNRLEGLRYIYRESGWVNMLIKILKKNGVQESDFKDAIHEGVIILDNHIRNFKFQEKGSLKNFFIGICKKRIYSNHRSIKRQVFKENDEDLDSIENITPEVKMLQKEQKEIIGAVLLKMGDPCKTVLRLYQLSYSMKEIGKAIGKSEGMAKKMSFTCRKKMGLFISKNVQLEKYLKS